MRNCFVLGLSLFLAISQGTDNAEASGRFSVAKSKAYFVEKALRKQFDTGVGVNFAKEIPVAGTGKFNCEAGFKFAKQNNGLSKVELNQFGNSPARASQIKAIIGRVFKVTGFRHVTVRGYVGHEMTVQPKFGPDAANTRGLIVMVETAQGRMTQMCITKKTDFQSALLSFRSLTKAIRMPE